MSIAGTYALVVVAATAYVEIATRQPGSQGLEALVLFAVTSPLSWLLMFVPGDLLGPVVSPPLFTAAGLFQAWLLWLIARGRKKTGSSASRR